MRNLLAFVFFLFLFTGCRKIESGRDSVYLSFLRSVMTVTDYARLEKGSIQVYSVGLKGQQVLRAKMGHEELVLLLSASGNIENGKIIGFRFDSLSPLNGKVVSRHLDGKLIREEIFHDGQIQNNDDDLRQQLSSEGKTECIDCTLPEVIVGTSYSNGESSPMILYSMNWLFGNDWGYTSYLPVYADGGGGGGAPIDVDIIEPTDKAKIDPKKFTDCFDQVSDDLATYTLTISADLPVDGNSCVFFNWNDRSPGHAYIELNKSNPYGSVRQNIGFYPNVSYKVLSGHDIHSRIVDDGGHEYQARYTISVSAAAFRAAINKLNEQSTRSYNVSYYNCVDFALDVFNAAGGNLSLPRYAIPGFGVPGGSHTPQGLYEQIRGLESQGNPHAQTTPNKEHVGNSKGPCE